MCAGPNWIVIMMNAGRAGLAALFAGLLAIPGAAVRADEGEAPLPAETVQASEAPLWSLRVPADGAVAYRGIVNSDGVGAEVGSVPYPAPNAAVLLVALITHGIVIESSRSRQRSAREEAADAILQPYRAVLEGYRYDELMRLGIGKMAIAGGKQCVAPADGHPEGTWLVDSMPVFSLTQDQRALVLDNAIAVHAPGVPAESGYRNVVRAVSQAMAGDDPVSFWTMDEGRRLKEVSAALLAESLDAALDDMRVRPQADEVPYKTFRYREGGVDKVERAQPVGEYCQRVVMRTLRGGLMIVPAGPGASGAEAEQGCQRASFSVAAQ